jgi:hypothetical protein
MLTRQRALTVPTKDPSPALRHVGSRADKPNPVEIRGRAAKRVAAPVAVLAPEA